MSTRDEILGRLRGQKREESVPPSAWQTRRHFEDLAGQFEIALTAAGGEAHHLDSLEKAVDRVVELLNQLEAGRVVVNGEPPLAHLDLSARLRDIDWFVVGQTEGDLRAFCAAADVGLSGADCALAETGSIIISSGPSKSRLATLLPPVHLALVPISSLTTDIFTWRKVGEEPFPANMTIVSGPSKSADIEQTLSTGVHGPKRFIVLLYDD